MGKRDSPEDYNNLLIEGLKHKGELDDPRIEAAFRAVPRHLFLPNLPLERAYADDAIPIKRDEDGNVLSSISQPSMIIIMLKQLQLRPGDNVLEIGAGTGYNAALMQYLVGDTGRVTTIEVDQDMVQLARENLQRVSMGSSITLVHGDGALGYAPRAAYDRIIATVGIWDVPETWVRQLKTDGILVAPMWLDALQASAAFQLQPDNTLYSENNLLCGFIQLRGESAGPRTHRRIGSSALTVMSNEASQIDSAALHALLSDDLETAYLSAPLSSAEFWHSFMPYLMLYAPSGYIFGVYILSDDAPAYGIEGHGFMLLAQASACFVPYRGQGRAYTFGSADAFLTIQDCLTAWDQAKRPTSERLRMRLLPASQGKPAAITGRLYARRDHFLHVWLEHGTI